ncbi:MAG: hypothetical protein FJY86_02150 [Candidatus Diapherotrites archaeon]|uniref:Uncharacterized protein n=1 Tax=Candidatus Iainarchaeum sp. TaxID=3101447 RepID=A0A8T4C6T3_9ARCH|nr:hypothetical protein [Candidatus Diapherotrites archaeon]
MKTHYWMIGMVIVAAALLAVVIHAPNTEAQANNTPTPPKIDGIIVIGEQTIDGIPIPVIQASSDIHVLLQEMKKTDKDEGFIFATGTNPTDDQYLFIEDREEGNNNEAFVLQKVSTEYTILDCERGFATFASYALDFDGITTEYLTSPVTFSELVTNECDDTAGEGSKPASAYLPQLKIGTQLLNNSSTTIKPIDPSKPAASGISPKTSPTLSTCEIASTPPYRIKMGEASPEFQEGGDFIAPQISTTDNAYFAENPSQIVFEDPQGNPVYLMQIWHFNENQTIAAGIADRFDTAQSITWDIIRNFVGQGVDNTTTLLTLGFWGTDIGKPIEAITSSIDTYNERHPNTTDIRWANQIVNLPGFGGTTIGMRLCGFENGKYIPYWDRVEHSKESIPNGFFVRTNGDIISGTKIMHKAHFISPTRGPVDILYNIDFPLATSGASQTIRWVRIKAGADPPKDILRFKLSNVTIETLRKNNPELENPDNNPETDDRVTDNWIYENMAVKLIMKNDRSTWTAQTLDYKVGNTTNDRAHEGWMFNDPSAGKYFTTASEILERETTGKPKRLDNYESIFPGEYTMELTLKGYKKYTINLSLGPQHLTNKWTSIIKANDLFILTIPDFKLEKDCTTTCNDLVSCLACMDSGIVSNFRK